MKIENIKYLKRVYFGSKTQFGRSIEVNLAPKNPLPKSSKVISHKVGGYGLGEIPAQASKYDLDFKQSNLTVVLKYFSIFEVYVYF